MHWKADLNWRWAHICNVSVEQHCAKKQHKPLSAPLLKTVKSLFYSFFSTPKSLGQLLSDIIFFWCLGLFPFCWFFYYHAYCDLVMFISSPGKSCSSQGAIPGTSSSTCGQGGALKWNWAQTDSSLSQNHSSHWWMAENDHTQSARGTRLPTAVSHRGISLNHSLPFPLLIWVLSFHCTQPFFFQAPRSSRWSRTPLGQKSLAWLSQTHPCHWSILLLGKLFPFPSALEIACPDSCC